MQKMAFFDERNKVGDLKKRICRQKTNSVTYELGTRLPGGHRKDHERILYTTPPTLYQTEG